MREDPNARFARVARPSGQAGYLIGKGDFIEEIESAERSARAEGAAEEAEEIAKLVESCVKEKPAADSHWTYSWYRECLRSIANTIRQRHAKPAGPNTGYGYPPRTKKVELEPGALEIERRVQQVIGNWESRVKAYHEHLKFWHGEGSKL